MANKMKLNKLESECVENKFLMLPNIQIYKVVKRTEDGFVASIKMNDGYEFNINVYLMNRVYPSTIVDLIRKIDKRMMLM